MNQHKKRLLSLARQYKGQLLFLFAAALIFACETALARAGGGGGFSGGGGGSGSGGSGGSGGGVIIYLLFRLVVQHPLIGIPVVILIIFVMYQSSKKGHSARMSHTIRRANNIGRSMHIKEGLLKIRERDPAFTPEKFIERCSNLLPAVQYAWSNQVMTPVRHFISDGVFERFSLQIEMQKGSGIRNQMSDIHVLKAELIDAASDDMFDTIHLTISAEAIDQTIAIESNKRLQGGKTPEKFTEIWTFLRRPGVKTLERPGLLEGYCPNCGTQLQLSTSITCTSCKALINSGEYDWVLNEITQSETWSSRKAEQIKGFARIKELDQGFNIQAIEDRVSAVFWHHRTAEFFATRSYLNAVALPEFVDKERYAWEKDDNGRHRFYADAAVGRVDVAEIIPGAEQDDLDRVRVMVEWSAHRELEKVPGLFKPQWDKSRFIKQDYIMVRKCGVQSVQDAALTSLHCPGCGAPQEAESNGQCRYCGVKQNDGSTAWVLESVVASRGVAREPLAAIPIKDSSVIPQVSTKEQEMLIQCIAAIMLADGVIDPKEERHLHKMAAKHNIEGPRLYELIHQVQAKDEVRLPSVDSWEERNDFFRSLVQMCLADGNVSSSERQTLHSLVTHMGYTDVDIDVMIKKERTSLYAASKATIKAGKRSG